MAEEFEGKVTFIGFSNNDTVEDGKRYQNDFAVPYTLAHAPEAWELFGNPYRPTTIVLGPRGAEVMRVDGPITYETMKTRLQELTT